MLAPKNDVNSRFWIHENTVNCLLKRFISWIVPFYVKFFYVPTNSTISDTIRYLTYLENAARIKLKTSDTFPKVISAFQNLFQINLILEIESQLSNYSNKHSVFEKYIYGGSKWGILREPTTFPTPPHCWQHWVRARALGSSAIHLVCVLVLLFLSQSKSLKTFGSKIFDAGQNHRFHHEMDDFRH